MKKMAAMNRYTSVCRPSHSGCASTLRPMLSSSICATMAARVVSLNRLMKRPTLGGMTRRNAWGKTIRNVTSALFNPSACAASIWPEGMACRPPRTFSATYAALKRVMPMTTRVTFAMRICAGKKSGTMICAMNRIVTSGTPRTTSM